MHGASSGPAHAPTARSHPVRAACKNHFRREEKETGVGKLRTMRGGKKKGSLRRRS